MKVLRDFNESEIEKIQRPAVKVVHKIFKEEEEARMQLTKDMEEHLSKVQKEWYKQNGEKITRLQQDVKNKEEQLKVQDKKIKELENLLAEAGIAPVR